MRTYRPRLRGAALLASVLAAALSVVGLGIGPAGSPAGAQAPGAAPEFQISATATTGLTDGQQIEVTVTHDWSEGLELLQCTADALDLEAGPDRVFHYCRRGEAGRIPAGTTVVPFTVRSSFESITGQQRSCAAGVPGDCVLYVAMSAYAYAEWLPIEFGPAQPYRVAVEPAGGLTDGQDVEVTVTGHDRPLRLVQCTSDVVGTSYDMEILGEFCTGGNEPVVPAPGPATVTTRVAREFRSVLDYARSCGEARGACVVGVFEFEGGVRNFSYAPVDFAPPPRLELDPAAQHTDGQQVRVLGSNIPNTYAGPPFWEFPSTGGWVLTQCAAGVEDDRSILGVFANCEAGTGLEVHGGLVTTRVDVSAAITSVLGDEIRCTGDACVVALARVERDGAVTVFSAPLSFGG